MRSAGHAGPDGIQLRQKPRTPQESEWMAQENLLDPIDRHGWSAKDSNDRGEDLVTTPTPEAIPHEIGAERSSDGYGDEQTDPEAPATGEGASGYQRRDGGDRHTALIGENPHEEHQRRSLCYRLDHRVLRPRVGMASVLPRLMTIRRHRQSRGCARNPSFHYGTGGALRRRPYSPFRLTKRSDSSGAVNQRLQRNVRIE